MAAELQTRFKWVMPGHGDCFIMQRPHFPLLRLQAYYNG